MGGLEHEALGVGLVEAGDVYDELIAGAEVLEGDVKRGNVVDDDIPLLALEVEELAGGGVLAEGEQAVILYLLTPELLGFASFIIGSDFEGDFEEEVGAATGFAVDAYLATHEAAEFSGNGEAEAGATVFAGGGGVDLGEGLEELAEFV